MGQLKAKVLTTRKRCVSPQNWAPKPPIAFQHPMTVFPAYNAKTMPNPLHSVCQVYWAFSRGLCWVDVKDDPNTLYNMGEVPVTSLSTCF